MVALMVIAALMALVDLEALMPLVALVALSQGLIHQNHQLQI